MWIDWFGRGEGMSISPGYKAWEFLFYNAVQVLLLICGEPNPNT